MLAPLLSPLCCNCGLRTKQGCPAGSAFTAQRAAEKNPGATTTVMCAPLPDPDHAGVGSFTRAAACHRL